jgi:hypothetical protein
MSDPLVVSFLRILLQATRLDPDWIDTMTIETSTLNYWASLEEEYSSGDIAPTEASQALFTELLQVMLGNVEYTLTSSDSKGNLSCLNI